MTTTAPTVSGRQRWLALMVLCLGVLMIVLDTTIVNVALPSIRDLLRTFLPPDEVLQRVGRMADLAGAADQPEEVRPVPVRGK